MCVGGCVSVCRVCRCVGCVGGCVVCAGLSVVSYIAGDCLPAQGEWHCPETV